MTCLKSTLPAAGATPALRTLAQALTAQALPDIEHAVIGALAVLGRELFGVGLGMAPEPTGSQPDAAALEYASWMPDPAALELASWIALLRQPVGNDSRTQAA